jgi:hypothetical protein
MFLILQTVGKKHPGEFFPTVRDDGKINIDTLPINTAGVLTNSGKTDRSGRLIMVGLLSSGTLFLFKKYKLRFTIYIT